MGCVYFCKQRLIKYPRMYSEYTLQCYRRRKSMLIRKLFCSRVRLSEHANKKSTFYQTNPFNDIMQRKVYVTKMLFNTKKELVQLTRSAVYSRPTVR